MIKLWKKGKSLFRKVRRKLFSVDGNVMFSIGENCLADDILARNKLKSFSSPYASGRSNIEYVLAFEKEQFADFVNPEYLNYEYFGNRKVVRNKKYTDVVNAYDPSVTNGFEFTHHDVFDEETRKTMERRCQRLLDLKHKNVIMLYHHRLCDDTDTERLLSDISELTEIYRKRGNRVKAFVFTQVLVPDEKDRKAEVKKIRNIRFYRFYTLKTWSGDDPDLLWAKCDNDLLATIVKDIRKSLV